jgi:hypothetical protein
VETDCAEAVEIIKDTTPNRSAYAFRVNVIRELLRERGCKLRRISREANSASHELPRLGRVQGRTKVWLRERPPELSEAIANDCNSSTE